MLFPFIFREEEITNSINCNWNQIMYIKTSKQLHYHQLQLILLHKLISKHTQFIPLGISPGVTSRDSSGNSLWVFVRGSICGAPSKNLCRKFLWRFLQEFPLENPPGILSKDSFRVLFVDSSRCSLWGFH